MGLFDLFKKKKEEPVKNAPTTTQAPRKPACEHGECVVCTVGYEKEELFCTCDKTVSCPKKQQYKIGEIWDKEIFPIIKEYSKIDHEKTFSDYNSEIKSNVSDMIVNTYVPQLYSLDFASFVYDNLIGVTKFNRLLLYLVNLKRRGVKITPEKKASFIHIAKLVADDMPLGKRLINADDDWLYNPSLYDIKYPAYTFKAFSLFSNKQWVESHILDTSAINIQEFYNADGTIKVAGDKNHPDEDSIYNVIEKWCLNNEKGAVFEREKEEREQKRREEEQRRREQEQRKREQEAKERAEKVQRALSTGKWE